LKLINSHRDDGKIPDEDLINMVKEGNTVAFGMLIDRHQAFIRRIVSKFLLRDEDTHELIQDTFIRVWKHLDEFDGRSRFTTWIYSIAFNLGLDRVKANKRRRISNFSDVFAHPDDGQVEFIDPGTGTDHVALAREVRSLAADLSRIQRLVFVLRDLQDMPVEEVCRVTGFGADKVKSNLYYARKFIREKLLKKGFL